MCAKNTKTNKDSSESRIETLYALLLDLLRAVLALGYLGNDSNYGAGVLLSRDRQLREWRDGCHGNSISI